MTDRKTDGLYYAILNPVIQLSHFLSHCAGFYVEGFQTGSVQQMSEEAIAEVIRQEITAGADGTNICSGVLGEVGCSWPITGIFKKRFFCCLTEKKMKSL